MYNVMQGIKNQRARALRIDLLHRQIEAEIQAAIDELKTENGIMAQKTKTVTWFSGIEEALEV